MQTILNKDDEDLNEEILKLNELKSKLAKERNILGTNFWVPE